MIILSRKLPRKFCICPFWIRVTVLPFQTTHLTSIINICAAKQNNRPTMKKADYQIAIKYHKYWNAGQLLLHWCCVCSQQPSLFTRRVLLELAGPVKTETFRCPQFTFPASVCQQKGTRFLDSFNNSLIWPFAFSSHQPPPPSLLCPLWDGTGVPYGCGIVPLLDGRGKRSHRQSC